MIADEPDAGETVQYVGNAPGRVGQHVGVAPNQRIANRTIISKPVAMTASPATITTR